MRSSGPAVALGPKDQTKESRITVRQTLEVTPTDVMKSWSVTVSAIKAPKLLHNHSNWAWM